VGGGPSYKLSSNEIPFPPVPSVVEAAAAAAAGGNRYPDMLAGGLAEVIADGLGVVPGRVVVGTGSVGVLGQFLQATCEPGDEVVMAWRSFEAYPIAVRVVGARPVQVPLTADARHDLLAMAAAVTDRTRAVLVCSPNNPTGPAVHRDEIEALLDAVAGRCPVLVDEAYAEFVRDPLAVYGVGLAAGRDDVVALRTFSKAHGLASLRVGFGIAPEPLADAMRATAVPFGVSGVAQAAALAALASSAEIEDRVATVVRERERVVAALGAVGRRVPDAQGNFVWLALDARTEQFVAECAQRAVTVRGFAGEGVRWSIGEPDGNDLVLDLLSQERWRSTRDA
jgi:histidinol-phosphate aminotransferase